MFEWRTWTRIQERRNEDREQREVEPYIGLRFSKRLELSPECSASSCDRDVEVWRGNKTREGNSERQRTKVSLLIRTVFYWSTTLTKWMWASICATSSACETSFLSQKRENFRVRRQKVKNSQMGRKTSKVSNHYQATDLSRIFNLFSINSTASMMSICKKISPTPRLIKGFSSFETFRSNFSFAGVSNSLDV